MRRKWPARMYDREREEQAVVRSPAPSLGDKGTGGLRLSTRIIGKDTGVITPPMSDITLDTPRLYLRPMESTDIDDLLTIFGDPKVMASFSTVPFTRHQMEQWLQRNLSHQDAHGYGLLSVILKSENILVGDCGLERMEVGGEPAVELGYDFRSDYWNRGLATEAAAAVRDFAFNVLALPSLISLIRVGNAASRRVSEKIGMQLRDEVTLNGVSYWRYSIDRSSGTDVLNGLSSRR
jgi:ribosomal-protein-alanine N-acetyltransferase